MKRKKIWTCMTAAAIAAVVTACGGAATYESAADTCTAAPAAGGEIVGAKNAAAEYEYAAEEDAVAEAAAEDGGMSSGTYENTSSGAAVQEAVTKKLIRNVNLSVETTEFDALLANVSAEVEALGGYAENFSVNGYVQDGERTGYITARIPSERVDAFLGRISEQSNVVFHGESVEDVTLQYVDLDSHKKALVTERDRLLELLEKAETVADIIEIESRLSEVNYQIESMESQLRTIDNQVTYSTVCLDIYEVKVFTPAAEKGVWERISDGFGNNVYYLLTDLENLLIGFLISLPYMIAWIVVLGACLLIVWVCRKKWGVWAERRRKKREEKRRRRMPAGQEEDYEIIPAEGAEENKKDGQDGKTV